MMANERFLRVHEAAEICRVCEDTIRRLIARGDIRAAKVGRRLLIAESELSRYLTENGQKAVA